MMVRAENREMELREAMFDCLKGEKISQHHYHDESFIGEFNHLIDGYVKKLTHRIEILKANGESVPLNAAATDASAPVVGDVNQVVVGFEGSVSNPTEVYDHMPQYDDMDMSVNEQAGSSSDHVPNQNMNNQEQFQYQTPSNLNLYDHTHPRFYGSNHGVNMNRQVPFQYQTSTLCDQNQPRFYGSSQDMNTCLSHDHGMNQPRFYGSSQDINTSLTHGQGMNQPRFYGSSQDMNTGLTHDQGMNQPRF
ncbi:unnamed protein product [Eruca vesicaria subsp. sativa]|uniref:Uncharacterized protein n=1 Tax=Eruca vesicaria subsp. sativa TaxID=29727 RepID=A0ABC8LF83_ERUVS|nr:unnamed protein product [Eruca vesicaria subsp. sativa]